MDLCSACGAREAASESVIYCVPCIKALAVRFECCTDYDATLVKLTRAISILKSLCVDRPHGSDWMRAHRFLEEIER